MEKVKVTQDVVDAVAGLQDREKYPHSYRDKDFILRLHAKNPHAWGMELKPFNGLTQLELTLVLYGHYEIINPVEEAVNDNPVLSRVAEVLKNQTLKGIEKYGHTVQPNSLSVDEWVEHASEEVADLLVYLQAIKASLNTNYLSRQSLETTLNVLYSELSSTVTPGDPRADAIRFGNLTLIQRIASFHCIKLGGESIE